MVHAQASNGTKQIKLSTSDIPGHGTVQIHHGPSFEKISFSLSVKNFCFCFVSYGKKNTGQFLNHESDSDCSVIVLKL